MGGISKQKIHSELYLYTLLSLKPQITVLFYFILASVMISTRLLYNSMQLYTGSRYVKWLNTSGRGLGSVKAHTIQYRIMSMPYSFIVPLYIEQIQGGGGGGRGAWGVVCMHTS